MEAYSKVHETSDVTGEEVVQEVEDINEAPMTAFQAGGGQAKLDQLNKGRSPRAGRVTASQIERQGQQNLYKAGGGDAAIAKGATRSQNTRGGGSRQVSTLTRQDIINKGTVAAASKPAATSAAKPATTPATSKPAATSAAKPAATPAASKPAATSAAKPAASKPATGMLGKTSFERRTPTSSELKAAQSARASGASPEKALQAAKSAGGALSQATAAASKPTAFDPSSSSSSSSSATAKPATPKPTPRQQRLNMDLDVFDLVKGYLLDEGYAETEEGAMVMMVNMSEGWRESILESCGVQLDEISKELAGRVVNARIAKTGAAADRENKARTPQNVRDTVAAADKEARARKLAAGVRSRRSQTNEEVEQLDEISLKTKMGAYAASRDVDADYAYGSKVHDQGDRIKKAIVKKHGEKAGENAERHAEVSNFGRKDASGKSKGLPKSRIEKSDYRTTASGKMHKQDQSELKRELRIRRGKKLRSEELELWVEELISEGYDLSNYTWEEVAEIYAQELELAEAQHARENPEGYDKEEKKKYEKVRGEKTPMPPRGDKRREDFEKWYAANVR
jgi:hypothetical protein